MKELNSEPRSGPQSACHSQAFKGRARQALWPGFHTVGSSRRALSGRAFIRWAPVAGAFSQRAQPGFYTAGPGRFLYGGPRLNFHTRAPAGLFIRRNISQYARAFIRWTPGPDCQSVGSGRVFIPQTTPGPRSVGTVRDFIQWAQVGPSEGTYVPVR